MSVPNALVEDLSTERHRKKVLGLAPRTAFVLIFIIGLIVIVGVVTGAVLGTEHRNNSNNNNNNSNGKLSMWHAHYPPEGRIIRSGKY
jgi:hypothetical protein